jgi:hypothetical protein
MHSATKGTRVQFSKVSAIRWERTILRVASGETVPAAESGGVEYTLPRRETKENFHLTERRRGTIIAVPDRKRRGCAMKAYRMAGRRDRSGFFQWIVRGRNGRPVSRALWRAVVLVTVASALGVLALPEQAGAWWRGPAFYPPAAAGYAGGLPPWILFPYQRPYPGYRYSVPPGVPLSYDDPGSGTTYCWSQTSGFYFACAYASPAAVAVVPVPPPPNVAAPSEPAAVSASGVLLFRLPRDARATINGVPIGLSDGIGIHSLAPGAHRVVLQISGKEVAHTVHVRSHRIFTVTPAGIVATEP